MIIVRLTVILILLGNSCLFSQHIIDSCFSSLNRENPYNNKHIRRSNYIYYERASIAEWNGLSFVSLNGDDL